MDEWLECHKVVLCKLRPLFLHLENGENDFLLGRATAVRVRSKVIKHLNVTFYVVGTQ